MSLTPGRKEHKFEEFELPFEPDVIIIDSLYALSIAFGNIENYQRYVRYLFEKLDSYNSVNFVITETEQDPVRYSRAGIEEFLADGVIVLYNLQLENERQKAMEILKLRSSDHERRIIPFKISERGVEIYTVNEIFA